MSCTAVSRICNTHALLKMHEVKNDAKTKHNCFESFLNTAAYYILVNRYILLLDRERIVLFCAYK